MLARLLMPADFGLIAAAGVTINAVQIFRDLGLKQTLIARKDSSDEVINAAFYVSFAMGAFLSVAMFLLSPLVAQFFSAATVTSILRALSVQMVISSLATVPTALLEKNLRFREFVGPRVVSASCFAITSLSLALSGCGVWSIVVASCVQSIVETILIWRKITWRPKSPRFGMGEVVALLSFSKYIVGVAFGTFLQRNVDTIAVGKVIGMSALGAYDLAFNLANALPLAVMQSLNPVATSAFSSIQLERERLTNVYLRSLRYLTLILFPMGALVILLAKDGILTFYGTKWEQAVLPLQILSIYALARHIGSINGSIFMVTNKVKEWNLIIYLNLALLVIGAIPATRWGGLLGISIFMASLSIPNSLSAFFLAHRTLGIHPRRYVSLVTLPALASAGAALTLLLFVDLSAVRIADYSPKYFLMNVLAMALKGTIFLASCGLFYFIFDKNLTTETRDSLRDLLKLNIVFPVVKR